MTAAGDGVATRASSVRFWNRTAERYARRPVADEAAYRRKLQDIREHLRPDMALLEFGCGTASTAIAHAPYVRQVTAVDLSQKMLEIARARAEQAGVANLSFRCAALEEFEAPDASFDAAACLSLLHLLQDRDAALAKVARLLKPGGLFVSDTACLADGMAWFRWIAPIGRRLGVFPLVRVFGKAELERSLATAGFEILQAWCPDDGRTVFIVARKAA